MHTTNTTATNTRTTARRIVALSVTAAALTGLAAAPSNAAAKRPAAAKTAAKTCKVASLDASASTHTETWNGRNITANDDWETASALCTNENLPGVVKTTSQLRLTPSASKTSGKISGKVLLSYSFGATQTGSFQVVGSSNYTCSGGTCETRMQLAKPGAPKQIIAVLIGLFTTDKSAPSFKVTFEDILISSIVSPRDAASGLPTG